MAASFSHALLLGAALLAAACSSATTEPPAAIAAKPAQAISTEMLHLQVKMRDGVRLDTSVWLPSTEGNFPVILTRTPYRTEFGAFQRRLLTAGYAIVEQHERGRFLSEGDMRMLGQADEDGWDTLDWIAKQSWSNGKAGTYGCSSSAENQLKLASLAHPTHKAMVAGSSGVGIAEVGPHREQGNFWRGGVWQMGWADYFFSEMPIKQPQLAPGLSDEERTRQTAAYKFPEEPGIPAAAFDKARMHLPAIELAKVLGAPDTELEEYLARGPSNAAWAEDRVTDKDVIRIPGLYAEAAYDISAPLGAAWFEKTRAANPAGTQAIVVTNGQHCSFARPRTKIGDRPLGDATFDFQSMALAWFDRWLKDDASAAKPAPVSTYLAGANRWSSFATVPTASAASGRTLFLTSSGSANTAAGNGALSIAAPAKAGGDQFTYDPANPVISHGGQISGVGTDQKDGAFDQREIEKRKDVLVYTTAPLTEDLPVFGFVTAELFVGSDAPDTDFTVKLVDVAPDGTAWNITDTIQRMRYREGNAAPKFMKPGEVYAITPPPMLAANVFQKGHSVRIEISSSNFPTYARNLNTAGDPYTTTETRIANNQLFHGPGKLSKIILPVAPLSAESRKP
ncbi:MAG: CocE/NonD family hydrolase [Hyphomonadaceae bacterium]|nr:CocE/NonD family hydrolase [Hyphomonadaceae bacterium]